jgi:hypothetical protein
MPQVNVVVPDKHADLVRRVGKGLRETEGFADSLRQFLDADSVIPERLRQTLAEQVADAVVAAIGPMLSPPGSEAPASASHRRQAAPIGQRQQFKMDL